MANISFGKADQGDAHNKKEWHKRLLKGNREKAIRKIKTELPQGVKFKEYLDILDAEIKQQ